MAGKNTAVFGIYPSQAAMEAAVEALRDAGFRHTDISVMYPENAGTKDFAHVKATKAPEGATTGGGTGAALGGIAGWLVGIGALAIPGVGPFIAAGPIVAALAGAGVWRRRRLDWRTGRARYPRIRSETVRRPRV